jgi:triosephosphate isomerase
MSGRKKIIIGNWKMNFTVRQAVSFAGKLAAKPIPEGVVVGITPHSLALSEISTITQKTGLKLAAQNAYFQDEGAFTGEISMPMLRGIASHVIIGHSERRHVFKESNDLIKHKVAAATRSGLVPILCIGETLVEKQHYHTKHVITDQLLTGLSNLTAEEVAKTIIAYEPVWAISSGKNDAKHKSATPEDAFSAQKIIRHNISELYGEAVAQKVKILYGGSVNADNATAFLQAEGVDGLLIGGASLNVPVFWSIVEQAGKVAPKKIEVNTEKK